jgi:hypothetical protein
VGALDARLDPHYRQPRQLLPLRRFQSSWRLVIGAFVVFWLALLPWFWLNVLGISGAECGNWSEFSYCMFRTSLGSYGPTFSHALLGMILTLLPILLVVFTLTLVQARKRRAQVHLWLAYFVTLGMLVISMACGLWYLGPWQILPQINQFAALTPVGLLLGLIGMALATVLSVAALLRATFALRALSAASPRQELLPAWASVQAERQVEQAGNPEVGQTEPSTTSSLAQKGEESSWLLKGVLAVLLLLFLLPWPSFVSPDVSFQDLLRQLFFASVVGGVTALLVRGRGKRPSEPAPGKQYVRDRLSLAVTTMLAFFMILAGLLPHLAAWLARPPGFLNWYVLTLLIVLACICIFPALVVRAQARNTHSERTPHRRGNLSAQAWIIILPVWFLAVCMELEYLFLPDYNSFAEVFVAWLMTGLAGLIIALAVKLGSKEQVDLSRQEAL